MRRQRRDPVSRVTARVAVVVTMGGLALAQPGYASASTENRSPSANVVDAQSTSDEFDPTGGPETSPTLVFTPAGTLDPGATTLGLEAGRVGAVGQLFVAVRF